MEKKRMSDEIGEPHEEVLAILRRSGIVGEIRYSQSMNMSLHQAMTVGRYSWHDEAGKKHKLFVLESFGYREEVIR